MNQVKVHIRNGCSLCGLRTEHTHPWPEWDRHVHGAASKKKAK